MTLAVQTLASSAFAQEFGFALPMILTLTGPVLFLSRPFHRASIEDRAKEGAVSNEEARRQIRTYSLLATVLTLLGLALLGLALFGCIAYGQIH